MTRRSRRRCWPRPGSPDLKLRLALPPPDLCATRRRDHRGATCARSGIETEITNVEWAQWLEQVFKGKDFDLTIVSHTEPMDIDIYARPDYYFQYGKPEFVALMDKLNLDHRPGGPFGASASRRRR